jgi:hypothetical protein
MIKNIMLAFSLSSLIFASTVYGYSNANFNGGYAFRLSGSSSYVVSSQRITVAAGVLKADGKGRVTGRGKFRSGGVTCDGVITSGNYRINADGTGVLTSTLSTNTPGCVTGVLDLALVLSSNGRYFSVANFENDYLAGLFIKQDKNNYTNNDFKGNYSLQLEGTSSIVRANQAATVGVGLVTADGNGNIKGSAKMRTAGITCVGTLIGRYRVDAGGYGVFTSVFTTSTPGCFTSVLDLTIGLHHRGSGATAANFENDYMHGNFYRQN